ncbi:hypothetical protein TNCV_899261 [Trichonephila clavipes]|nr:hypothetical protein TNCV_899261 [Trichonephila clavipes]
MSFARRPGAGRPRKTSCQEDRHIVRTGIAYCFIGHHPDTGSAFTRDTRVLHESAWLKDIWDRGAHYVCCP